MTLLPPDQFPHGLKVLVVDHDITMLYSITEICIRSNYEVTTCCNASLALDLLKETKNLYDVILIEAEMPDMDSYNFLQHVTQQIKIPVIIMSVEQSTTPSVVMKAIEKGACAYWIKPLSEGQIKTIWQHVVRKVLQENNQHDQILEILNAKGLKKRERDDYHAPASCCVVEKENDDNVNNCQPSTKKSRLSWSQQLHQQFLWAVNQLGIDDAKPRKIIKLMDVPGLTSQQVASHLQKLRLGLKRSTEVGKKKSKLDEFDLQALTTDIVVQNNSPNETLSSHEVVNSMPNSSIECDNISRGQPLNTDTAVQNNVPNETSPCLEVVNSMPSSSIECEIFLTKLDDIISECEAFSPFEFDIFN